MTFCCNYHDEQEEQEQEKKKVKEGRNDDSLHRFVSKNDVPLQLENLIVVMKLMTIIRRLDGR